MKLTRDRSGLCLSGAVLLAFLAMLPARADYPNTVTSQGPVGYWRLNETAQPPTGVSAVNQGTLGTSAAGAYNNYPTRGGAGPFAGSVSVTVNGLNQSVQAPYDAALNPASFTIEAWLNPAQTVPSGNLTCVLASMHSGSPRSGWLVYQSGGAPDTTAQGWQLRLYAQNGSAISVPLLVTNNHAPGTWVHLVFSYDSASSTAKGYLNGVLVNTATGSFVPNVDAPFSVGVRSDNGFYWKGSAAEVAYYGSALSDAAIASHYSTATSNPAGYAAQVTANSPLVYYRFAETPDPVAANSGTMGSAGNGIYIYSVQPGQPGPSAPAYPGFESDNKAPVFNRVSGAVSLPPMNLNTNTVTITAWVKPSGLQSNYAGIVFCRGGTTVSGLDIDGYGGLGVGYHWNNDAATYNWIPANDVGLPTLQDGVWGFVALVVQPTQAAIFIANSTDPNGFSAATNMVTHGVQNFEANTLLGQDSNSNDRRFNGSIDEVAIFNRSLKAGEIYGAFAASVGNVAARIFADPQSPANALYAGDTLVLEVDAGGSAPMTYQWRKDGVNVAGQTTAVFTKANVQTTDSGNYDVVVQAATGTSLTSAQAAVSVLPVEIPSIVQGPVSRTLYPGGTLNLTIQANGGALSYQWTKDGTAIAGATNSAYIVTSVVNTNAGTYSVSVNNRLGNVTGGPATITIPTVVAGSLESSILADKPEAWYRLDETSGSMTMWDAMGRHDGTWVGSPTLGAAGVSAGNTAAKFDHTAGNYGSVPFSAILNNKDFTMECWVKTTDLLNEICPVSSRVNTKGEWFYTRSGFWVGGVSSGGNNYYVPSTTAASTILSNEWTHLAISFGSSSNGSLRVYFNGQWDNQGYVDFDRNATGPLIVGARGLTFDPANGTSTTDMPFNGTVDEVVYYKTALAPAQIQNHFQSGLYGGNSKPVAKIQPQSQTAVVGKPVSFSAYFEGTLPISYQWMHNGSAIAGATTTTLNIAVAAFSDVGTYSLVASNIGGITPSANATLAVAPVPAFANATNGLVLHLRFDGDYQDTSGRGNNGTAQGATTIVPGRVGSGALHYSTDTTAGTYNYVTLGTPTDLAFGTTTSFSVGYWVRLPAGSLSGDLPFLCSARNSYGGTGFTFAPSYKLGGWSWNITDNGSPAVGAGLYGPDASINNGQWHYLLHTFDRTAGVCTTYLDGALANTTSIAAVGNFDTAGPINIGQDPTGTYGETGSGDLDDMAVWRVALTQADAAAIYQVGLNGTSFDSYGPVRVYAATSGSSLIISWQAGTLQESASPNGPWTNVTGATAPNYMATPGTTGAKFYRVQL